MAPPRPPALSAANLMRTHRREIGRIRRTGTPQGTMCSAIIGSSRWEELH